MDGPYTLRSQAPVGPYRPLSTVDPKKHEIWHCRVAGVVCKYF